VTPASEFELWNRGGWPRVDVVGEKFHEAEIRRLFPAGLTTGSSEFQGTAHLVPEPNNPHDPNAIAVRVDGNLIGYLAKEQASRYVGVISTLVRNGYYPTTACQVWAYEYQDWEGTDRRGRDIYKPVLDARATIVLDEPHLCVPANLPPTKGHRMLPHGSALQVKGEEKHLDVLAPLVSEHGEAWVYTTLHLLTLGSGRSEKRVVELRLDGAPIGQLTPAMSAHYAATIDHLSAEGQLVAAKTLLKGNPIQVEAVLHAAKSHELDSAWLATTQRSADATSRSERFPAEVEAPPAEVTPADRSTTTSHSAPVTIPPKPGKIVFRAPPGWPAPPDGWEPFDGWQPDPSWPTAPDGWQFWAAL